MLPDLCGVLQSVFASTLVIDWDNGETAAIADTPADIPQDESKCWLHRAYPRKAPVRLAHRARPGARNLQSVLLIGEYSLSGCDPADDPALMGFPTRLDRNAHQSEWKLLWFPTCQYKRKARLAHSAAKEG